MSTLKVASLCTGNAARSVMAGTMLEQLAAHEGLALDVTTAGTHAVEGQPVSSRVRLAIQTLGEVDISELNRHRSHQLSIAGCASADLIVAMEADHVSYVRRNHPEAAARTATIRRLVGELPLEGDDVRGRIALSDLQSADLSADVDVLDPAGRDQPEYNECALEIWELCQSLVVLLG